MDIKIVDELTGEEAKPEAPKEYKASTEEVVPVGSMLNELVAKDLFDFRPSEATEHKRKIETLVQYAKSKTDDYSPEGIKWAIRSLGLKLGTPPLGEKLINYLYRFARLDLESQSIEEQKKRYAS